MASGDSVLQLTGNSTESYSERLLVARKGLFISTSERAKMVEDNGSPLNNLVIRFSIAYGYIHYYNNQS